MFWDWATLPRTIGMVTRIGWLSSGLESNTPNEARREPMALLNLITSMEENDSSSTKNVSNRDMRSPKVASQAGRPSGHSSSLIIFAKLILLRLHQPVARTAR